jgi:hypothetical protein
VLARRLGVPVHQVRQALEALPDEEPPPAAVHPDARETARVEVGDEPDAPAGERTDEAGEEDPPDTMPTPAPAPVEAPAAPTGQTMNAHTSPRPWPLILIGLAAPSRCGAAGWSWAT